MDDIHTPTVASGPTSNGATNGISKETMSLRELIAEKDRVEAELLALSGVLDSHNVDMNTPLTTPDGFPRADIDVAQIRTTRARVIRLKNDYKDLMSRIEKGLHEHHANLQAQAPPQAQAPAESTPNVTSSASQVSPEASSDLLGPPFASINSVAPDSPAEAAGMRPGDKVVKFGSADWMNHEKLSKVAEIVGQSEGRAIHVIIAREAAPDTSARRLQLTLVPRRGWGGRGLLGCHMVPV